MGRDFVHPELHREVTAIGGSYELEAEARMPFAGGEVLYLVGHALFDTSCCGAGGCGYALVPGLVVRWKDRQDDAGLAISEVEPITDPDDRRRLEELILARERIHQVRFL